MTELNPIEKALLDYTNMSDDLVAAQAHAKQIDSINLSLTHELEFIRAELIRTQEERDRYKTYCIEITTRLTMIHETIEAATNDARLEALKAKLIPEPPKPDPIDEITKMPSNEFRQKILEAS